MKKVAMIPLITFDLLVNVSGPVSKRRIEALTVQIYLTILFLIPLSSKSR